jgi:hypothetical protein
MNHSLRTPGANHDGKPRLIHFNLGGNNAAPWAHRISLGCAKLSTKVFAGYAMEAVAEHLDKGFRVPTPGARRYGGAGFTRAA